MKIIYLELPDGDKLISYHKHDFKSKRIGDDLFFIDCGQNSDYFRVSNPDNKAVFKKEELSDLIEFIREDKTFGDVLIKNRTTKFIKDFVDKIQTSVNSDLENVFYYQVYKEELNYRNKLNK
jgi:hypothetical protein